jgi:hypothetical protein
MLGTSLTAIGMGAQGLAVGLELYKRTSDELLLGLVGLILDLGFHDGMFSTACRHHG